VELVATAKQVGLHKYYHRMYEFKTAEVWEITNEFLNMFGFSTSPTSGIISTIFLLQPHRLSISLES
jgi:hypothetical protein